MHNKQRLQKDLFREEVEKGGKERRGLVRKIWRTFQRKPSGEFLSAFRTFPLMVCRVSWANTERKKDEEREIRGRKRRKKQTFL